MVINHGGTKLVTWNWWIFSNICHLKLAAKTTFLSYRREIRNSRIIFSRWNKSVNIKNLTYIFLSANEEFFGKMMSRDKPPRRWFLKAHVLLVKEQNGGDDASFDNNSVTLPLNWTFISHSSLPCFCCILSRFGTPNFCSLDWHQTKRGQKWGEFLTFQAISDACLLKNTVDSFKTLSVSASLLDHQLWSLWSPYIIAKSG